jgi:hypothetical protein
MILMRPKPKYPIVVRVNKSTKQLELFMVENGQLGVYCAIGGHSLACRQYMLENTEPAPPDIAQKAFDAYTRSWKAYSTPILRKRLKY